MVDQWSGNQRGVSLVEVLAAVIILGIAVVIFVQLSDYSGLAAKKSEKTNEALQIAEQVMNTIRNDIDNLTPHAHYPLDTNPYVCTRESSLSACQQLAPSYELTIHHQPYTAGNPVQPAGPSGSTQVSTAAIVHYQLIPTLITVTVKWGNHHEHTKIE